jgi:hypothetical protein
VESGKRFRLRLVGGLCAVCGVEFSIEGHIMTLIATDGTPVNPVTIRSVVIFSGTNYHGWRYFGDMRPCRSFYTCGGVCCLQLLIYKAAVNVGRHNLFILAKV